MNNNPGLGGSTPQFNTGGRSPHLKPLFYSYREQALILEKFVVAGFGDIITGTVMAKYDDKLVPYVPDVIANDDIGRVFLAADAAGAAIAYIPNMYSSRFTVGDDLAAQDDASTDLGAIVSIDVDDVPGLTKIVVTNNFPATGTVVKLVNIFHKTKATTPFSAAVAIIDKSVATGVYVEGGVAAQGAQTSYVVSNAILYKSAVVGLDTTAATAIGAIEDSPYVILK